MKKPRVEIYPDAAGYYRWRLVAANGKIVATSGEGYVDRRGATRSWDTVNSITWPRKVQR